jgi:hypothetical protein
VPLVPPQQRGPSGGLPHPVPQPALSFQAVPPPAVQVPAALPPAIQVRPAPQAVPLEQPSALPPPSAGAASPPAARLPLFLAGEKELLAGLLVGVLGVVALVVVDIRLPPAADGLFVALTRGLILWGTGLLLGLASPRGRRGRFPRLALLVAGLTLAAGFPLVQIVVEGGVGGALGVFYELFSVLAWFLLSLPFLLLGATATWLAIKVLGKDER